MSKFYDIMVLSKNGTNKINKISPETICELLEHKNRFISCVEEVSFDERIFNDTLGNYCSLVGNSVIFQMKHYNQVMLPLWNNFINTVRNFSFLDFSTVEGIQKIKFENAYSPNIIYYDPEEGYIGYGLEDFFRSNNFVPNIPYTLHGVYTRHE